MSVCFADHQRIHDNPAEAYRMGWLLHPGPVNLGPKYEEAS